MTVDKWLLFPYCVKDPAPAHSSTPDHKKSENKKVQEL